MPPYDFQNSVHFDERMEQRGFLQRDVQLVVNSPEFRELQRVGPRGGNVYKLKRSFKQKKLVVVAEIVKNDAYLITAYYES